MLGFWLFYWLERGQEGQWGQWEGVGAGMGRNWAVDRERWGSWKEMGRKKPGRREVDGGRE